MECWIGKLSTSDSDEQSGKISELTFQPHIQDKYKAAAKLVDAAIQHLVPLIKEGASVLDLCREGDKKLDHEADKVYNKKGSDKVSKGIAFPTTINVNNVLSNCSPLPSDKDQSAVTLKKDDVVKITIGAHIDGYASIAGETVVVGDAAADVRADLVQAAYQAAEIALRSVKPGSKNWEVTAGIAKVLDEYKEKTKVKGVESGSVNAASHGWRLEKDDIQAKKTITPFPTAEQRRDSDNSHNLEEGEVYTLTVSMTNAEEAKVS